MLCIYIQLCTLLRKAKQDDSELLVGLLPLSSVREKVGTFSSTNLHVAIFGCCHFVYFSADCEQSLFFFRFNEGRARASVRRHEDVSSLHALAVTRVLHDGKKRDCSSSNLLPPFFFLNFLIFVSFHFFSNRTFSTPPPPELRESHSQF